jgi:NAD(P)-dependent dehydrogenase (short-subunit alcohol dehydrogenase family)
MKLSGQVAVVTGGGSGIGLATANLFAQEGGTVVAVDRNPDPCEGAALRLTGDVGDEATVRAHAAEAVGRFGHIDVLVTAAGWSTGTPVPETSLDQWEAVLRTNLTGTFLWAREAVMSMRGRGGSIVFVGSQLAQAGGRGNAAYLASKGAVVSLAKSMALDHAAERIRTNVVVPGAIDTPLLSRAFARAVDPQAARRRSIERHPLGRLGRPEEVAKAILFLASADSAFTTGSCLMVDGGWLAA